MVRVPQARVAAALPEGILKMADRKVIDHDREFDTLARRVFKRLGVRPVFMPKCVDGERVASLLSPRVVRAVRKRASRRAPRLARA